MSPCIVEYLEVVQVEEKQCATAIGAVGGSVGLLQAIRQQDAIGQAGQLVIVGQLVDSVVGQFARSHVGVRANVVADTAVPVNDRRDGDPMRMQLGVLFAVPDFTFPDSVTLNLHPDGLPEIGVMAIGFQQRHLVSNGFVLRIACDLGKGRIHPQDHVFRVSDHHALMGFEGNSRDAQLLFNAVSLGKVAQGAGKQRTANGFNVTQAHLHIDFAAVFVQGLDRQAIAHTPGTGCGGKCQTLCGVASSVPFGNQSFNRPAYQLISRITQQQLHMLACHGDKTV